MRGRLTTLIMGATLTLAPAAGAFGTLPNFKGSQGEHERITRRALGCEAGALAGTCFEPDTIDLVAGRFSEGHTTAWGAVGGPDRRLSVIESAPHCDNGDAVTDPGYPPTNVDGAASRQALMACHAYARKALDDAVNLAGAIVGQTGGIRAWAVSMNCALIFPIPGRAKCRSLRSFGMTLHVAQDFYSHSNWSDEADMSKVVGARNPTGLNQTGPSHWMSLRTDGADLPSGLFTGCFDLPDETSGCSYGTGAQRQERVMHAHLNKDTGSIPISRTQAIGRGTSTRGRIGTNFEKAVAAAVLDTEDKWLLFQEEILREYGKLRGELIICALKSDKPLSTCQ